LIHRGSREQKHQAPEDFKMLEKVIFAVRRPP
jgi:hypothetical protein